MFKVGKLARNSERIALCTNRVAVVKKSSRIAECSHPHTKQLALDDGSVVCEQCGCVVGVEYISLTHEKQTSAQEDVTTRADVPDNRSALEAMTSEEIESHSDAKRRRIRESGQTYIEGNAHRNAQRAIENTTIEVNMNSHVENKNRAVQKELRSLISADLVVPEAAASQFRKSVFFSLRANYAHHQICTSNTCSRSNLSNVPAAVLAAIAVRVAERRLLETDMKDSVRVKQAVQNASNKLSSTLGTRNAEAEFDVSLLEHINRQKAAKCPTAPQKDTEVLKVPSTEEITKEVYKARSFGLVNNSTRDSTVLMLSNGMSLAFWKSVSGIDSSTIALILCCACGASDETRGKIQSVPQTRLAEILNNVVRPNTSCDDI